MRALGNDLVIGNIVGTNTPLVLPRTARDKHLYICGSTGTGKSKLLESLIRQDIVAWSKSKCGVILLDPHGSLYDNLMAWLAWHKLDRPIVPIDLRRDDWVISYNLLRQRTTANTSVIVDNFVEAMAYVWGQVGTDATPLFARWASTVVRTLYDNNHTLIESDHLTDRVAKRMRQMMGARVKDSASRQDWDFANTLTPKEFEAQIGSTVNRLQRFIRNETIRPMFGQSGVSLDMGKALEEGTIILVNLATEKGKVSKEVAELFGTLLLSDLWTAAQERGKPPDNKPLHKPTYLYCDEFQRFVTPTIAENLDEARGYGIHCTLAHQFPNQLLDRGDAGRRVYNSIMENASSKIVFRLSHEDNLVPMAKWLFTGVMNPDEIKHQLFSTKVMRYVEEYRTAYAEGRTQASGGGSGMSAGTSEQLGGSFDAHLRRNDEERWGSGSSETQSNSDSWSESHTSSQSKVPMLIPQMGSELSHVQFRSLDEQLFRAMAVLFDQKQRQGVARLAEMRAPVSIVTPTIKPAPSAPERVENYRLQLLSKLDFALPAAEARARIANREAKISKEGFPSDVDEPVTAKRRVAS